MSVCLSTAAERKKCSGGKYSGCKLVSFSCRRAKTTLESLLTIKVVYWCKSKYFGRLAQFSTSWVSSQTSTMWSITTCDAVQVHSCISRHGCMLLLLLSLHRFYLFRTSIRNITQTVFSTPHCIFKSTWATINLPFCSFVPVSAFVTAAKSLPYNPNNLFCLQLRRSKRFLTFPSFFIGIFTNILGLIVSRLCQFDSRTRPYFLFFLRKSRHFECKWQVPDFWYDTNR